MYDVLAYIRRSNNYVIRSFWYFLFFISGICNFSKDVLMVSKLLNLIIWSFWAFVLIVIVTFSILLLVLYAWFFLWFFLEIVFCYLILFNLYVYLRCKFLLYYLTYLFFVWSWILFIFFLRLYNLLFLDVCEFEFIFFVVLFVVIWF